MTNTTDHFAVVRDRIDSLCTYISNADWQADNIDEKLDKCLNSLTAIEANYLPLHLLPEGWHIENFCMNESGEFLILLMDNGEATAIGIGKTPNAAFMAALEKVKE